MWKAPGVQVVALVPVAGPVPPHQGGDAAGQGRFDLLGADEVDVGVDAAGREDVALPGDGFGSRPHHDRHPFLGVGVAGFANANDAAVLEADIGFDDPPPVEDQGIGDCLLYTSPSPRDMRRSRMPSSA